MTAVRGMAWLEGPVIFVLAVYFGVAAIGGSKLAILMVWWLGIAAGRYLYRPTIQEARHDER